MPLLRSVRVRAVKDDDDGDGDDYNDLSPRFQIRNISKFLLLLLD